MMGIQTQLYDVLNFWFFDLAFFLSFFVFLIVLLRHVVKKKICLYEGMDDGL